MNRRTAKDLLHLRDWLQRAGEIVGAGPDAYTNDPLRQEAGDSLMMKIGEAANRLDRAGIDAPTGVRWADAVANRNWLIHQYDQIDRAITCATLEHDLAAWREALATAFTDAEATLTAEAKHAASTSPEEPTRPRSCSLFAGRGKRARPRSGTDSRRLPSHTAAMSGCGASCGSSRQACLAGRH